jgi:glutathione S-transferase
VQAELLGYFYPERLTDDSKAAAQVKAHAEARVGAMFDRIEASLAAGGPYLLGARFSVADLYLLMLARWTRGMANPARDRTSVRRLLDRLIERPAVQRALATEKIAAPVF